VLVDAGEGVEHSQCLIRVSESIPHLSV
jgi:hypothetical protein